MEFAGLRYLRIPLFALTRGEDPLVFAGLTEEQLALYRSRYERQDQIAIYEALKWAAKHPEYPFHTLLPDLPADDRNIYLYLLRVLDSLRPFFDTA